MKWNIIKTVVFLLIYFGDGILIAQDRILSEQQESLINEYRNVISHSQNKSEISSYLNKIAYIYWGSEYYKEAADYFTQSLEINKSLDNKNALKVIYGNLGLIYTNLGKHDKALEAFNENLKLSRKLLYKSDLISALINIASTYENLKRFNDAINSANEALELAKEESNLSLMRKCYNLLAENYAHLGKSEKSVEYTTLFVALDKQLQKETGKKLERTEASLKVAEQITNSKQSEIDMLQKDKLIQSLKIQEQEIQIKFEQQLLETQNELQAEQEKQLLYERMIRRRLTAGIILISFLALTIFVLYRKLKDKEKRLKESEEKFRKLFEDSEDVLLLFDQGNIIDCNLACSKFLGFDNKQQLINAGISNLLPLSQPDDSNSYQKAINKLQYAFQNGYARYELLIKKVNGDQTYVDVSHTAITILGKKVLYSIWRDIDWQKKAEIELNSYKEHLEELVKMRTFDLEKAKSKAEESDRLKSVFLANMSHEIKTPLNAIIGVSKMLLKYQSDTLNEKQKESVQVINDSGNRLFRLLDDILEYSEISAGVIDLVTTNIKTELLKHQIAQIAMEAINEKPIKFSITITHDFPPSFLCDQNKLLRILNNLIGNAAKFTEKGTIHIAVAKSMNKAIFKIWDSGQGIRTEDLPKVFEGFKQLDDSASRKHSGTGLGLSICKGFVDLLGGTISVESEYNKGTCVSFEIPIS
jgi:PAS domain S-box-containing protein